MDNKVTRRARIKQKLINKYRLVILNDTTFQELLSLKLSRLNVFVFGGIFSFLLIILTIWLIAFTSLKEYIPGYSSTDLKKKATRLVYETDSLKIQLEGLKKYIKAIRPVLTGDVKSEVIDSIQKTQGATLIYEDKLKPTEEETKFREKIESNEFYPLAEGAKNMTKLVFFAPITGIITQGFNAKEKHFAIDVSAKTGTPVKAITDGTVILAEWTAETGYVIVIQHINDFISVYKHNGSLLKEQGEFVKSGEAIAHIGSTGEHTTGPHLHFELWNNGYPVNPKSYIDFQ